MAGLLATLETLDLDQLSGRLERAQGAVGGPGAATLQGFDVRGLLGDLGELMRDPKTLPASPEAVVGLLQSGLSELGQLVQLPDLQLIAEVEEAVRDALAIVEAVVERLSASHGGSLLDDILGDLGGLGSLLTDLVGRAVDSLPSEFPESIRLPFTAAAILSGAQPPSARELADILAGVVVGIDLDGLAAPGQRVDGFTASIGAAGGDLAPLEAQVAGLTAQLQAATGLLVQAPPDVRGAVAVLQPVASGLDALFGSDLPQAIGAVAAGVESLDAAALAVDVERLLDPVLALIPTVSSDLEESLLGPLRSLHATLDALTPDAITGALAVVRTQLTDAVASSDLQEVPQTIDLLFDALVEQLQRVPLRALRDELLDALAGVEARVRDFAGFDPAWAVGQQVQSLQQAIAGIDLSAIQDRVQELQQSIQGVLDEFPMAEIRDDLSGLVQTVADALADFTPALDQLSQQVDALAGEVRALDLDQAGSASIDVIAGIREQVSDAVGSGDVPEALRPAIAIAAQSLRGLDVSVSITAPFAAAVDGIDPSELLAPIDDALGQVRRTLDSVTPAAVVARLDDPFEQLVHALEALRPAALVGALSHEFQSFLQLVEKLDPRTLAAGLEQAFEHVLDQLRAAADPAPLLAPLHTVYADLQALVDRLDLEKALGGLVEGIAGLPRSFADAMHGSLAANPRAGDAPPLPDGTVFQLGDMLRPISELLAQIRDGVEALAEPLLTEALDLVGGPLQTLRRLADPGHGLLVEVAHALDQRRALVDPLAQDGPFAELRAAVDVVAVTSAGIDASAGDRATLDGAVASVRLDGRIEATAGARARLDTAGAGLGGSLGDPGLVSALDRLSIALDAAVPATLASQDAAATGAARVAAIFDAIDLHAVVTELDAIGQAVQARLNGLSKELSGAMARMIDTVFGLLDPVLPDGLLARFHDGMERVHAELSVLDPTPIEQEAREVLDALLAALRAWSPAAIAEELGGVFDALHGKLAALDPATLLGGLDPLAPLIDGFAALKPSTVLAPLVDQTTGIEQALERLAGLTLGQSLVDAVAALRAQLELVVADVQHELDTLLDDLGRMSGDASVSASIG